MSNVLRLAIVDPNDSQRQSLKSMLLGMDVTQNVTRLDFTLLKRSLTEHSSGLYPNAYVRF
jgi:hypothetical protein